MLLKVKDARGVIIARGDHARVIGAQSEVEDSLDVSAGVADAGVGASVPEADGAVDGGAARRTNERRVSRRCKLLMEGMWPTRRRKRWRWNAPALDDVDETGRVMFAAVRPPTRVMEETCEALMLRNQARRVESFERTYRASSCSGSTLIDSPHHRAREIPGIGTC